MGDTNITMVRGDTLSFGMEYDGTEQDLDSAIFGIRSNVSGGGLVVSKTIGDGISKVGTGKYIVRVAPEDTRYMNAGTYRYDFQVGINDDVFTLLEGALTIEADQVRI